MSKSNKNSLEILLGSKLRVKVLKYLFRNYPEPVGIRTLSRIIQEHQADVLKELSILKAIGLVNRSKQSSYGKK